MKSRKKSFILFLCILQTLNEFKISISNPILIQLKDDPKFEEFVEAHLKGGKKQIWNNDATIAMTTKETGSDDCSEESDSGVEGTGDYWCTIIFPC